MATQYRYDQQEGFDYYTITSGARKADGHPHAPMAAEAIEAEQGRVDELAAQFFALVKRTRGLSVEQIRNMQAAIYTGREARERGLIDGVMGWGRFLETISLAYSAQPGSSSTNPNGDSTETPSRRTETGMSLGLEALIKKTAAKIAAETDITKRATLAATLAMYEATKTAAAGKDDDDCDDDEEKKAKKEAEDKKAKKEAKKEADEKKAAAAAAEAAAVEADASGTSVAAAIFKAAGIEAGSVAQMVGSLKALRDKANQVDELSAAVAELVAGRDTDAKTKKIERALAATFITKKDAKWLRSQESAVVESYLAERKTPLVVGLGDEHQPGVEGFAGEAGELPAAVLKEIDDAVKATNGLVSRDALIAAHKAARAAKAQKAGG